MNALTPRLLVRVILMCAALAATPSLAVAFDASPAPASTAASSAPSVPARPKNADTTPQDEKKVNILNPSISYSIWLYVFPTAVIFSFLFYTEWDSRRKKKVSNPPENASGQH